MNTELKRLSTLAAGLSTAMMLGITAGCSPKFWRQQADRDAYKVIAATLDDPRVAVPRFDITPDPGSRFFDPHPADCAPLPPDDPNAHQYMHAVDGWKGYNGWHKNGQSLVIENPQWYANIGLDPAGYNAETGRYEGAGSLPELTLDDAVNLALIHGRTYQQQIEDVYQAALQVSAREFAFGVRYFARGTTEPEYNLNATLRPGANRVDQLDQVANFGIRRLLPSGATFAVGLANTTMWMFTGGGGTESIPRFTYNLTQPLLAAGGRKIVLEDLTQDQRSLLYELRSLARFRREYFTDTVATQAGGYLGLLQQVQTIRNQIENISRLERQLDVLRAQASQKPGRPFAKLNTLPAELGPPNAMTIPAELAKNLEYDAETGILVWSSSDISETQIEQLLGLSSDPAYREAVDDIVRQLTETVVTLDVLQLESTLANSVNGLRNQERRLQDSLDAYKIFLGLPTDFPLAVDSKLLEPFQFIDAGITQLDRDIEAFVDEWAQIDVADPDVEAARQFLAGLRQFADRIEREGIASVKADLDRIDDIPLERLSEEAQRRLSTDNVRDLRLFNAVGNRLTVEREELDEAARRLDISEKLSQVAAATGDPLAAAGLAKQAASIRREISNLLNETRYKLLQDAQSLAAIQIGVRADFITVEPVDATIEQAVRIGLENRLDLMNARARVTDAWREVERTKQLLRSSLDVTVDGVISGPANQRPFDFSVTSNTYRFGLEFDTPLDQIDERNAYRNAQVAYQQQRRAYMLAEDNVKRDIRIAWRQLQVLQKNLETAKRAVRINALRYDVAVEQSNAPAGSGGGGQAGVRGRNLLDALDSVLDSQNALIGIFVDYETNRLRLARDMGVMTIGEDGVWDDPLYRRIISGGSLIPNKSDGAGGPDNDAFNGGQFDRDALENGQSNGQPNANGQPGAALVPPELGWQRRKSPVFATPVPVAGVTTLPLMGPQPSRGIPSDPTDNPPRNAFRPAPSSDSQRMISMGAPVSARMGGRPQ